MTAPRIEIDLAKIRHNTRCLVQRLKPRGINVTGVTKAVQGHSAIAKAMIEGGVIGLADARISNVERMRGACLGQSISMIRTPMPSQVDRIVRSCNASYNTEIDVIAALASAARRARKVHDIILMVEMGDMREGIMPDDVQQMALEVVKIPGVALTGIGANFACLSGIVPDTATMNRFSVLADDIEGACGPFLATVSGGNSANLPWALGRRPAGRVNNLRLGEAILLGVDPVSGDQIDGLYTDAFTLVAEVIETKIKSEHARPSFTGSGSSVLCLAASQDHAARSILAIGQQDTDGAGLTMPAGVTRLGMTSDHLVIHAPSAGLRVGSEVNLKPNYSALMRSMAAPDVEKVLLNELPPPKATMASRNEPVLALI